MKKTLSFLLAFTLLYSLCGCGNSNSGASSGADAAKTHAPQQEVSASQNGGGIGTHNFNFFVIQSEATTYYASALKFAEMMNEASEGKIVIQVHANGSLSGGDQSVALEMIQKGTIDMGMVTAAVCGNMINDLRVTLIPFVFDGEAHVDNALMKGSELYTLYEDEFNQVDIHMLGIAEHGFRDIMTTQKSIISPEDLKGLKVRVLATPVLVDFYKAMGVNVTDISNTEIYTALQNGTIDAQENPLVQSYLAGYTSVASFVTTWDYCYDAHPFLMSNGLWNSLTPEEQALFTSVTEEWIPIQRQMMRDAYQDAYDSAVADGATIVDLTEDQKDTFRIISDETSKPYIEELSSAYDLLVKAKPVF